MRAWLTPDSSLFSNPPDCRTLTIPGDLWLYVQGALEMLAKDYNWEQFGTATPEETSQFFMEVLDNFSTSECGGGGVIEWLQDTDYRVIEVFYTSSSNEFSFVAGDLPEEAQEATGLIVNISINTPSTGASVRISDPAGNGRQTLLADHVNGQLLLSTWCQNPAKFVVLGGDSTARAFSVSVVGWFV